MYVFVNPKRPKIFWLFLTVIQSMYLLFDEVVIIWEREGQMLWDKQNLWKHIGISVQQNGTVWTGWTGWAVKWVWGVSHCRYMYYNVAKRKLTRKCTTTTTTKFQQNFNKIMKEYRLKSSSSSIFINDIQFMKQDMIRSITVVRSSCD